MTEPGTALILSEWRGASGRRNKALREVKHHAKLSEARLPALIGLTRMFFSIIHEKSEDSIMVSLIVSIVSQSRHNRVKCVDMIDTINYNKTINKNGG